MGKQVKSVQRKDKSEKKVTVTVDVAKIVKELAPLILLLLMAGARHYQVDPAPQLQVSTVSTPLTSLGR